MGKTIVLLGDFNIDLKIPQHRWNSLISSYHLRQFVTDSTRVTDKSSTLIDHIYADKTCQFKEICVVPCGISDHFPVCVTFDLTRVKIKNRFHEEVRFRNFSHFNYDLFVCDKDFGLLDGVLSTNDPDSALALLVQIISHIFDKHAPYCKKRIKSQSHNPWFTKEIKNELRKRDYLLKHGPRDDYKKQRNFVKTLIRSTKKSYFETLIKNNGSQKCIWNAINLLTGKKKHVNTKSSFSISAEEFSSSFASTNSHRNNLSADDITKATRCTKSFCSNNLSTMTDRHIFPFMSVSDLLNYLQSLKPKKSSSFDNISVFMLKLAAP